jgi:hypothetical protein
VFSRLGINRHVSDADLTNVWADARLGDAPATAAGTHVRECAACRARLASLTTWLDGLRADARQEADDAFPRERLAVQQAQILRRLEAMERPARVLAFPRFTQPISTAHTGRSRWIAGAAAAGLLVGIGLGQIFQFRLPTGDFSAAPAQAVRTVAGPERVGIQPVSFTDEDLLYDGGSATALVPESLRSLHEITPSVREYEPR